MWRKLITRCIAVQTAQRWAEAFSLMRQTYGLGMEDSLVYSNGSKTEYYVDSVQWQKFLKDMGDLLEDAGFVETFAPSARQFLEEQSLKIRTQCAQDFSKLPGAQLKKVFDGISAETSLYYTRMWMVFLVNEQLERKCRGQLEVLAPERADGLLLVFASPLEPTDALNERIGLLEIALDPDIDDLKEHCRRYAHIPMFDFNDEPYVLDHFRYEIRKVKNPGKELEGIRRMFRQRRRAFAQNLAQFEKSEAYFPIKMLSDVAFLRDYRDMLRQKMNLALRNLYGEIARRAESTINGVSMLSSEEISSFLAGKTTKAEIQMKAKERQKTFVAVHSSGRFEIFSGKEAEKIASSLKEEEKRSEVSGLTGSPGAAEGVVRIINTNKDLHKILDGDVLVAPMTRQDFVPYMRRAKAIVTDEGGITCHAAIVSRELGVPCIVGTGNATSVLRDGQKVRVDANKGKVELLD